MIFLGRPSLKKDDEDYNPKPKKPKMIVSCLEHNQKIAETVILGKSAEERIEQLVNIVQSYPTHIDELKNISSNTDNEVTCGICNELVQYLESADGCLIYYCILLKICF